MEAQQIDTIQFYIEVGEKVRHARKIAGMDQENLARHLGLSRTTVINIEKGRQRLSLEQAWHASQILSVPITNLLPKFGPIDFEEWAKKIERNTQIKDDVQKKVVMAFINKTLHSKK